MHYVVSVSVFCSVLPCNTLRLTPIQNQLNNLATKEIKLELEQTKKFVPLIHSNIQCSNIYNTHTKSVK